jgi:hypothetical protein
MRKLFVVLTAVVALTVASKVMVSFAAEEAKSDTMMKASANMSNEAMNEDNAMGNEMNNAMGNEMNNAMGNESNSTY